MSLLQEIHGNNAAMLASINATENAAEAFYSATGLDLSDCLYREENFDQLKEYAETGRLPENPRGFDYTDLIEKGFFSYNSRRWLKAHYYGKKTLIEIEIAGYLAYCKTVGIRPQIFAHLKFFLARVKAA